MELRCQIQSYAWGKCGSDSIVASLMKPSNPNITIDEKTTYAELWMGTHSNGPSFLKDENKSLDDYIKENKHTLGSLVLDKFGSQLPFLFKILSVNKALSIQVHPNKKEAEELHKSQPNIYKDSNHKPELAIALTPFEALCGFRPVSEIKNYLKLIPELSVIIGEDVVLELFTTVSEGPINLSLKKCFQKLMTCDENVVAQQLKKFIERVSCMGPVIRQLLNLNLLERLYSDYPGDVGCFGIYFFNYLTLQPGEAMYLGANEPHAYLSGDCIECMACSDNVVRAGLTPKLKDTNTLINLLSYKCEPSSAKRFQPSREDDCTEVFRPPVPDFAVTRITIPPGRASYTLIERSVGSILIIVNGKAEITFSTTKVLNRGSVIFIPANERVNMKVLCGCHPMLMFQAFANV